jgi:hypothetical protein
MTFAVVVAAPPGTPSAADAQVTVTAAVAKDGDYANGDVHEHPGTGMDANAAVRGDAGGAAAADTNAVTTKPSSSSSELKSAGRSKVTFTMAAARTPPLTTRTPPAASREVWYHGHWAADQPHGAGEYRYANGDRHEGQFSRGERHGAGVLYRHGEVWRGTWTRDCLGGSGKYTGRTGDVYDGDFLDGKKHGKGRVVTPGRLPGVRLADWLHGAYWLSSIECVFHCKITW